MRTSIAFRITLAALVMSGVAETAVGQTLASTATRGTITDSRTAAKPTIVLVHGAFADGTGWQRIIPLLERDGYSVIAVQNPLTSLADDVATTKRLIDAQVGPVVVVGHSYGGAVMTGAATSPNVKGLVYLAAFAPDAGQPLGAFLEKFPSALGPALRPDAAGFVYIDRASFRNVFAKDLSAEDASVMAATQKPVHGATFSGKLDVAAWKSVPTWYLVSQQDHVVNPDLARFYAKRMGATTTEINASHVAFISHPAEVARLIKQAAMASVGGR